MRRKSELRRKVRLSRGASPTRRGIAARATMPKRKKRSREDFDRIYGSEARVRWVREQPCVACGRTPCENMHIAGDGIGRKANADQIIPACRHCHRMAHDQGIQTFARHYNLDLPTLAAQTQRRWLWHLRTLAA